ncbi:MAG: hypothetical protein KDJ37_16640 [Hyphomicrobiaceae bacterium]|nr:hypothetical protein [Hyphomicrobiaceae bacterium]
MPLRNTPARRFPRSIPGDGQPQRLLTFLALHTALGAALGIAFAAVLVLANVAGIKDLLQSSSEPVVPMILFFASFALTFGSIVVGIAVMSLPLETEDDDDGGPPDILDVPHRPRPGQDH